MSESDTNPDIQDTSGQEHWLDAFESFKNDADARKAFAKYDKADNPLEAALRGGYEAQKLVGKTRLPDSLDAMNDEERSQLHNLRGVIESEDGLELDFDAGLPEGAQHDEALAKTFVEFAVAEGLTPTQAQKGIELWNGFIAQSQEALTSLREQQKAEAEKAVRKIWRGDYDANNILIERAIMHKLGVDTPEDPKFKDFMAQCYNDGVSTNPILTELLGIAAKRLEAEGVTHQGDRPSRVGMTSDEDDWEKEFPNSGPRPGA